LSEVLFVFGRRRCTTCGCRPSAMEAALWPDTGLRNLVPALALPYLVLVASSWFRIRLGGTTGRSLRILGSVGGTPRFTLCADGILSSRIEAVLRIGQDTRQRSRAGWSGVGLSGALAALLTLQVRRKTDAAGKYLPRTQFIGQVYRCNATFQMSLAANIKYIDNVFVFDTLIAAHDNCLVWIKLREFFEEFSSSCELFG